MQKEKEAKLVLYFFGRSLASPFDVRQMEEEEKKSGILLP